MRHILVGSFVLALCACGQTPGSEEGATPAEPEMPAETVETAPEGEVRVQPEMDALDRVGDRCGIAPLRGYLGEAADEIPDGELPEQARIVGPDTQVTMDYVPRRLNILTDEAGTVIGFKCG
ncbi:MAG: hypothetical protein GVY06_03550 [Alphaproteobacteria bacterium]|jgi:hypothetical protein|nr:hypothetical protein [Alphaproteobacteria bacterium]